MTITILLIPANLKVRKEALHGFIEGHAVFSEFVPLEVILEVRRSKAMPIDHGSFYRGAKAFPDSSQRNDLSFEHARTSHQFRLRHRS